MIILPVICLNCPFLLTFESHWTRDRAQRETEFLLYNVVSLRLWSFVALGRAGTWFTSLGKAKSRGSHCPHCRPIPAHLHTLPPAQPLLCPGDRERWALHAEQGLGLAVVKQNFIASLTARIVELGSFSAKLLVTSWCIIRDKRQYFSSTPWTQYIATHKTVCNQRALTVHLSLELLPFYLRMASERKVTANSLIS